MSTRRGYRQRRPQLKVGQTGIVGVVADWLPHKRFGFIQPANKAARIIFHDEDVPRHREKCVGVGQTVYFDVARGSSGKLKALVK
jgi:cold shock CspA family protein